MHAYILVYDSRRVVKTTYRLSSVELEVTVLITISICGWFVFSRDMRFPKIWYVRPAKAQTSLRIRAVWSELLLVAWIFYECWAADWTPFRISKLKIRLHRLVWVYTCLNAILLEITCRGSFYYDRDYTLSLPEIYQANVFEAFTYTSRYLDKYYGRS